MVERLTSERSPQEIASVYGMFLKTAFNPDPEFQGALERERERYSREGIVRVVSDEDGHRRAEVRTVYDAIAGQYMLARRVDSEMAVMKWLIEQGLQDTDTLSVGSGPAPHEIFLKKMRILSGRIVALDFSHMMKEVASQVANANGIYDIEFVEQDAVDMVFKEGEFGLALFMSSINWIDISQGRKVVGKVVKALRPGGDFFSVHTNYPLPNSVQVPDFALARVLEEEGAKVLDLRTVQIGEDMPRVQVHARKI